MDEMCSRSSAFCPDDRCVPSGGEVSDVDPCRTIATSQESVRRFEPGARWVQDKDSKMKRFRTWVPAVMLASACLTATAYAGGQDIDMLLGQDGSPQHKLVVTDPEGRHFLTGELIELAPGDGLNDGYYVSQFPGWSAKEGVPNPLLDGNQITLNRISSTSNAFDMLDPFTGTPILGADGDAFPFPFGGGLGHEDVFYRADAALVTIGDQFTVTFQLTDPSGLEAASDPFTLSFMIVPEPLSFASFSAGFFLVLRRKT